MPRFLGVTLVSSSSSLAPGATMGSDFLGRPRPRATSYKAASVGVLRSYS